MKQRDMLTGVQFVYADYRELVIPPHSIIYCDPPYGGTTKYHKDFDSDVFWNWTKTKAEEGHKVYVSEYQAPEFARCVWSKERFNTLAKATTKRDIEKLFVVG